VKDKLGVEPGGEGKLEASHRQQQATEAVNNFITAQLQATGRNLAHHITASA
jgi:phospholipase/lecithinase/hemolysin